MIDPRVELTLQSNFKSNHNYTIKSIYFLGNNQVRF